jgi:hypothetical protein
MKKNIYLYLFIFAALIALITYVNGRKYQEELEEKVESMRSQLFETDRARKAAQSEVMLKEEDQTFSLKGNPEAEMYFQSDDLTTDKVQTLVQDQLLQLNIEQKGGNPLIPHAGVNRGFQINNMKLINHKWVLANFSDGRQWGEIILSYEINDDKKVTFETLTSFIYPFN